MRDIGLQAAIEAAGSIKALAELLGISKQAVWTWKRVPAERAHDIQASTGIPLYVLRPDLWGKKKGTHP